MANFSPPSYIISTNFTSAYISKLQCFSWAPPRGNMSDSARVFFSIIACRIVVPSSSCTSLHVDKPHLVMTSEIPHLRYIHMVGHVLDLTLFSCQTSVHNIRFQTSIERLNSRNPMHIRMSIIRDSCLHVMLRITHTHAHTPSFTCHDQDQAYTCTYPIMYSHAYTYTCYVCFFCVHMQIAFAHMFHLCIYMHITCINVLLHTHTYIHA